MHSLRYGWTHIVQADDYELHMANIGQAQANAELVRELVLSAKLPEGAKLLFAGAGPGQMFDYADSSYLQSFNLVFTDINESFLQKLEERAKASGLTRLQVLIDDVEDTQVPGPVAAAIFVLVLEHVDWQKCLKSTCGLEPDCLILVVQRNPEEMASMVAPHRQLPGSLNEAAKCEKPCLIDQMELVDCLAELGFDVESVSERKVPDGKTMCGFVFKRRGS